MDDDGSAYTAYGFLVMWRGRQSGGYRRFGEFRALATALSTSGLSARSYCEKHREEAPEVASACEKLLAEAAAVSAE